MGSKDEEVMAVQFMLPSAIALLVDVLSLSPRYTVDMELGGLFAPAFASAIDPTAYLGLKILSGIYELRSSTILESRVNASWQKCLRYDCKSILEPQNCSM